MPEDWNTTTLISESEVLKVLVDLQGKHWLNRGQPECYKNLIPSIDREPFNKLARIEKLQRERKSIDQFKSTARFFTHPGEQESLRNDVIALMVLRHYEVPTRLLDWSMSPYVATYFAICEKDDQDGEIWSFNQRIYEIEGAKQWVRWPETMIDTVNGRRFDATLTAFSLNEPPEWIVAQFYSPGFPRQVAQFGAFTMMARFGIDHAYALRMLLKDKKQHHRYIIKANLKQGLRKKLREDHGIWRGSLFPDTAGAAKIALEAWT